MARPVPMSRLLQGDVGSGKTVVAAGACLVAVRHGYQAALMAPTEVLAQQHFRTVERLLAPFGLKVGLITGSLRRAEKNRVWAACTAGEVDVLVGTHALIQEEGAFRALGLAVVDEQHRFGVRQRGALRRKGVPPGPAGDDRHAHPAHPGPLPLRRPGRLRDRRAAPRAAEIKTFPVSPDHRHRAYDFLRRQVRNGRQGFIICPLIDESDKIEARAAKGEYERLQRQFPDLRLALLHGKMPPREKEQVMVAFRDGFVDVLVSTAVVEVGIDVPNATVMLIEGADRFGLSQLHQFRGRVGRGEHQSYCLLLSDSAGAEANPRLQAVVRNQDGFALAEEDLKLRGPGEFFGTRQSGLPDLRVARLSDVAILEEARRQAQRLDARDPGLAQPEHALLKASVDAFWQHAEWLLTPEVWGIQGRACTEQRRMRVIAGEARGVPLVAPPGRATRPTSDRTKEAMFAVLGDLGCEGTGAGPLRRLRGPGHRGPQPGGQPSATSWSPPPPPAGPSRPISRRRACSEQGAVHQLPVARFSPAPARGAGYPGRVQGPGGPTPPTT